MATIAFPMKKPCSLAISMAAFLSVPALADMLPDSIPTLTPFGPGLSELTYQIALTSAQKIVPGDEFVILDVANFDHWETPPGAAFALTTELLTPFSTTFGGGIIDPPDDPNLLNLRFTYIDPLEVVGPVPFTPLSGLIFQDDFQLVLRANNFAAHTHQVDALGGLPTVNVASVYVPASIPEASTVVAGVGLAFLAGARFWRRR